MKRTLLLLGWVGLLAAGAGSAWAAQISGNLVFLDKDGKASTELADARNAVVFFEPSAGVSPGPPRTATMLTRGKQFAPLVLAVPRGSTVRFPNEDKILHNVFSVSGENRFDLGLYSFGTGKVWTFKSSGVVRVFCNVHHSMVGFILVLDTPYFVSPTADGRFNLAGVPDGPGRLTIWHPQVDPWTVEVRPGATPVAAKMPVVRDRVPSHLNKAGKNYSRDRRDQYN